MSDAVSIATKSTHATGVSRASVTSSKSYRRKQKKAGADWRLLVRDGFASLFDLIGDWVYFFAGKR